MELREHKPINKNEETHKSDYSHGGFRRSDSLPLPSLNRIFQIPVRVAVDPTPNRSEELSIASEAKLGFWSKRRKETNKRREIELSKGGEIK